MMPGRNILFDIALNRPELPVSSIPRKKLEARLEASCAKDFTLISAPAGYGKSRAVSAWAASTTRTVVWFSLSPEFATLSRFYALLSYGLAKKYSDDTAAGSLEGVGDGGSMEEAPKYLAALLARQVRETAPQGNIVIVLDDYHLCDGTAANAFLLELSNQTSALLKIMLCGRTDPGLPVSRLRAQGRLEDVRTAELRFGPEDLAAFLELHADRSVPAELQDLIERKTEGWPAGLQMLCMAMSRAPDIEGFIQDFSATHRFVLDYLMDEVLAGLEDEWTDFLYRTSIAEPFTADLCSVLCGVKNSDDRLRGLDRMNLFLIKLDGDGRWYRYHHLFRDLLRMRAGTALQDELPSLRRAASLWYRKEGLKELSFHQLLDGGFIEDCFRFLEEESRDLYINGGIPALLGLYGRLPLESFQSHPEACVWFGWLLASVGKVRSVPTLVAWAEESLRHEVDEGIRRRRSAGIASIRAMAASRNGEYTLAESEAAKAKDLFPEGAARDRAVASFIRATALLFGRRFAEAEEELDLCRRLATAGGDAYTQGMALSERARLHILQGRAKEALGMLSQAEVLAHPGGKPALWCGMVYIYAALAHRALGDADKAMDYARRGVELARLRGNAGPLVHAYRLIFDLRLEAGDPGAAGDMLAAMEGLSEEFQLYPESVGIIEEARSRYAQETGAASKGPGAAGPAAGSPLSRREAEVLTLLAQGCTNQDIADRLFLSVGTVKTHLHNISEKLGTANRTETVALARRLGYLPD